MTKPINDYIVCLSVAQMWFRYIGIYVRFRGLLIFNSKGQGHKEIHKLEIYSDQLVFFKGAN